MKKKLSWFEALPFGLAFRLLWIYIIRRLAKVQMRFSFSEFAEDIIAANLLEGVKDGFYVDAGCNEPLNFSNTFALYLEGWRGINIDANEDMIRKCRRVRK